MKNICLHWQVSRFELLELWKGRQPTELRHLLFLLIYNEINVQTPGSILNLFFPVNNKGRFKARTLLTIPDFVYHFF
jgi:hypothetical protein